jgi:hypothetical protein
MNQGNLDLIAAAYLVNAVLEDILHKGHQQHRRDRSPAIILFFKFDLGLRPDPYFLQRDIVVQELHFRSQRNGLQAALVDKIPHDIRQPFNQQRGAG